MIKVKKITLTLLIMLISMFTINKYTYAFSISDVDTSNHDSSLPGSGGGPVTPKKPDIKSDFYDKPTTTSKKRYYCMYDYKTSLNITIDPKVYDLNGEKVINDDTITVNKSFAAGTWVGLNIKETQLANWSYNPNNFEYYEVQKQYTCTYNTYSYTGGKYPKCVASGTKTETRYADYYEENGSTICSPVPTSGCGCSSCTYKSHTYVQDYNNPITTMPATTANDDQKEIKNMCETDAWKAASNEAENKIKRKYITSNISRYQPK